MADFKEEFRLIKRDELGRRTDKVKKREINKMIRLSEQGLSVAEIHNKLKRDARTIRKHLGKTILEIVSPVLRPCLTNPHLEIPNKYARFPLKLNDKDWCLDPITWFYLCTPDFSEEGIAYWEDKFLNELKKSSFWNHYQKLKIEVYRVQIDYENSVLMLADKDREVWQQIQRERYGHFLPSRVPISPEPDWDQWKPYYDCEYCDRVIRVFNNTVDDLTDRLCGLEELLQQLNEDLIIKKI